MCKLRFLRAVRLEIDPFGCLCKGFKKPTFVGFFIIGNSVRHAKIGVVSEKSLVLLAQKGVASLFIFVGYKKKSPALNGRGFLRGDK